MKNSQRGFVVPLVLVLIAFLLIGGGAYVYMQNQLSAAEVDPAFHLADRTSANESPKTISTIGSTTAPIANCGMTINSPFANAKVLFPLTVSGVIDNRDALKLGCLWGLFEGEAGNARLFFLEPGTSSWQQIGAPVVVVLGSNWMTAGPVPFSFNMTFNNDGIGLPSGTKMKIVFTDNQQKDGSTSSTLELPLVLQ